MGYTYTPRHFRKPTRSEIFFKNVLVTINTLFAVFGFILFVYGFGGKASINRVTYISITENGGNMFQATSNFLIFLGIVLLVIGVWGLFGFHSLCKSICYIGLLSILAFVDTGLAAYSSSIEEYAKHSVEDNLVRSLSTLKTFKDPMDPSAQFLMTNWNALQSELKCCGVHEYKDWFVSSPIAQRRIADSNKEDNSINLNNTVDSAKDSDKFVAISVPDSEDIMRIPHSCFKNGDDGLLEEDFQTPVSQETILENIYSDGCLEKTVADLDIDRMERIGIIMAVTKMLAVICACAFTYHLRRRNDHNSIFYNLA